MPYVLWRKGVLDFLVIGHERSSDDVEHAVGVIHAGKIANRMNIIDKYLVLGNKGLYDTNGVALYFGYNISGKHAYAIETFIPRGIGWNGLHVKNGDSATSVEFSWNISSINNENKET